MYDTFDFARFSHEVEHTATALLDDGGGSDAFIQTARVVQEIAESALASNRRDSSHIACRAGCGSWIPQTCSCSICNRTGALACSPSSPTLTLPIF